MTLSHLKNKHRQRFPKHPGIENLLPNPSLKLESLRSQLIDLNLEKPQGHSRKNMQTHFMRLQHSFRGRSILLAYHALAISYLRRDTPYQKVAWSLFQRMWREQSEFLLSELNFRWLISSLQTFFDHSPVAEDRTCGGIGYTYGNLIKIYEAERSIERHERLAKLPKHLQASSVNGAGSFKPGSDILMNLHRTIYDAACCSSLVGPILVQLMLIVQSSDTAFSRIDELARNREDASRATLKMSFGEIVKGGLSS